MKHFSRLLVSFVALLVIISPSAIAYAQNSAGTTGGNSAGTTGGNSAGTTGGCGGALCNPLNNINSLPELLKAILQAVVELGSILLVIMLVYVGFLFVVAQGKPEELSKARSALIWTLIGGMILLGATAIQLVVTETVKQL